MNGAFIFDGAIWTDINNGINNNTIYSIALKGSNIFVSPSTGGIYSSLDNGASWHFSKIESRVRAIAISGESIFLGTESKNIKGIYKSTDDGNSWKHIGLFDRDVYNLFISEKGIFASTDKGVYHSNDLGETWNLIGLSNYPIRSFIVVGGWFSAATERSGLFVSKNSGTEWARTGLDGKWLYTVAYKDSKIFVGAGDGLYMSSNDGLSWDLIGNGLPNINILSIVFSGSKIIVAVNNGFGNVAGPETQSGVYVSDNLKKWNRLVDGFINANIYTLLITQQHLYVGTPGAGVWRRPINELVTNINNELILPNKFNLSQNYPNPFNPTTTIKFSIPKTSVVTLKVYDVLGREVATLINGEKSVGDYDVKFDAGLLPNGIYFYRLQCGNLSETKKLILLK